MARPTQTIRRATITYSALAISSHGDTMVEGDLVLKYCLKGMLSNKMCRQIHIPFALDCSHAAGNLDQILDSFDIARSFERKSENPQEKDAGLKKSGEMFSPQQESILKNILGQTYPIFLDALRKAKEKPIARFSRREYSQHYSSDVCRKASIPPSPLVYEVDGEFYTQLEYENGVI